MRATITISNLDVVQRKPAAIESGAYLQPVATSAADLLRAEMRKYPPPPPNSTYRRTGTLGKSWAKNVHRSSDGWLSIIGTRLKYAPYVQDETRQAEIHQGRWQTIQSVAKDKRDEVVKFCVRAIRGWLAKG